MSIFYKLGRLTYKTQRVVTDSTSNPIKEFTQGYSEIKANQAKIDDATAKAEELGLKITPKTFAPKTPVQGEFDFDNV